MEKCMLQKLAEARCEPNEVQVESKEKAIKAQAAKKSFIEEMMGIYAGDEEEQGIASMRTF